MFLGKGVVWVLENDFPLASRALFSGSVYVETDCNQFSERGSRWKAGRIRLSVLIEKVEAKALFNTV